VSDPDRKPLPYLKNSDPRWRHVDALKTHRRDQFIGKLLKRLRSWGTETHVLDASLTAKNWVQTTHPEQLNPPYLSDAEAVLLGD